jgi:hypothetical protein
MLPPDPGMRHAAGSVAMSNVIEFPRPSAAAFVDDAEIHRARLGKSIEYRLTAAELSRRAEIATDAAEVKSLLQNAVCWIQLAENEEWLVTKSLIAAEVE